MSRPSSERLVQARDSDRAAPVLRSNRYEGCRDRNGVEPRRGHYETAPEGPSVCQGGCIGVLALLESEGDGDVCLVLVRTKPCFDLFSEGALCFVCGRLTIERNSPGALATLGLA